MDFLLVQFLGAIGGFAFLVYSVRQNQKSGYRKVRPQMSILEEGFLWMESVAVQPAAVAAPTVERPAPVPVSMPVETGQLLNLGRALAEAATPVVPVTESPALQDKATAQK